jgi:hypothetical protein
MWALLKQGQERMKNKICSPRSVVSTSSGLQKHFPQEAVRAKISRQSPSIQMDKLSPPDRKGLTWMARHRGLEAKLGLEPDTPGLEHEEEEKVGLSGGEGEVRRLSHRAGAAEVGTGLKRGGEGPSQAGGHSGAPGRMWITEGAYD